MTITPDDVEIVDSVEGRSSEILTPDALARSWPASIASSTRADPEFLTIPAYELL